ncbi:MAG: ABC transporter ATP-binding protein [Butyrivibrio sp.]|jgi:ABC-type transport system involved in cytochrome bd biosynthesis fused ATPase/permease subunit|nr:ABC transporter ATP-binding protein [Butyrivibrio sp.]
MYITKDILWLAKRYKLHLIPVVAVSMAMSLLSAFTMVCLAKLILAVTAYEMDKIVVMTIGITTCYVICFVMRDIENRIIHANSVSFKEEIRKDLLKSMFAAGPVSYSSERTGTLSNMIWMKVDWLEYYFNEYLPRSISIIIFHLMITIVLFNRIGAASLLYMGCILLVVMTPIFFNKEAMKRGSEEWEAESDYSSDIIDRISGMATLKALNQTSRQLDLMERSTMGWFRATLKNLRFTTFENNFMSFFIQSAKVVAIIGALLFSQKIGTKTAICLVFLVIASTDDAFNMLAAWIKGAKGISGVADIIEFLRDCETHKKNYGISEKQEPMEDIDEVRFNEVSFSYDDKEVLKNVNLKLERGKNIAIVGPSGSGKSTLAYLLSGLYEPDSGHITCVCNGVEKDFTDRNVNVSAIWQDSRLFIGTVSENMVMGNSERSTKDIKNAAIRANIHQKISELEKGYDTLVGDGGEAFSGGEKQRVLIARALLKDSSVIIFDEATAFLDRDNEKLVKDSIKNSFGDKMILTIAHRIETVESADYVYFIKNGEICDLGTHEELLEKSPEYRKHFGLESA